jgi:hypothetical protein
MRLPLSQKSTMIHSSSNFVSSSCHIVNSSLLCLTAYDFPQSRSSVHCQVLVDPISFVSN